MMEEHPRIFLSGSCEGFDRVRDSLSSCLAILFG